MSRAIRYEPSSIPDRGGHVWVGRVSPGFTTLCVGCWTWAGRTARLCPAPLAPPSPEPTVIDSKPSETQELVIAPQGLRNLQISFLRSMDARQPVKVMMSVTDQETGVIITHLVLSDHQFTQALSGLMIAVEDEV